MTLAIHLQIWASIRTLRAHGGYENSSLGQSFCFCSSPPGVEGQSSVDITLDQAIDLALAHNHSLKAARTLVPQNQAQEITANLRPNPTLGFDTQYLPVFQPQNFSLENLNQNQEFDAGISYLFERGHKRQRRLQAAQDQTAVTRFQVTDAERTLTFGVAQQFVAVLLAESTLQFSIEDLKGFSADRGYRAGAGEIGRDQRRRLPEDQAATAAIPNGRLLLALGQSAGACRIKAIARL